MKPITLTTERLVLRPHTPEDAAEVHSACQDPEIQRWISVPVPYEPAHAQTYVTQTVPAGWREDTAYNFAVRLGADGPLVATLAVHRTGSHTHEIGYWTVAAHRGRGYMTEALRAAVRWACTEAGVVRLVWRAAVANDGSRAVAEKAGFLIEGVQRAGMEHDGTLLDCWAGALLPSDLGLPSRLPYEPAEAPVNVSGAA
ncbi:GNAT family N-acetyltransferase [Streptomyces sp. NPDC060028]|uniref:GNAT family N-acetyltransferase n=1 Tax=Streptomyces sp. NPDC060028 TaxID=3347041 RepID=UPI00367D2069